MLCTYSVGAHEVMREPSSILAETWSGVFRVDPPKKFDGVPRKLSLFFRVILGVTSHCASPHGCSGWPDLDHLGF